MHRYNLTTEGDRLDQSQQEDNVQPTNSTTAKPIKRRRERRYMPLSISGKTVNESIHITMNTGRYSGLLSVESGNS
jgi:hypothetical protein